MLLPKIKNDDSTLQLMQDKWASILNPVISQPLSSANILTNVELIAGTNVINHLLARKMQGWIVSDIDAASSIFRSSPLNDKTLTLDSSANCIVNLVVF